MSVLDRFLGWMSLKPKHKMSKDDFHPNNFINHPYKTIDVLLRCLEEFGFKEKDWRIRVSYRIHNPCCQDWGSILSLFLRRKMASKFNCHVSSQM